MASRLSVREAVRVAKAASTLTRASVSRMLSTAPPFPRKVVVTGVGMVTPLGANAGETWRRLLQGDVGMRVRLATARSLLSR